MTRNRKTVAVIGEGITEKYFIQSLRDILQIKPGYVKPKNSSLKELAISINDCIKKGYSRIYCMIDMDNKVCDGDPDHERNAKEYAKLKRQYHNKQHKSPDGSQPLVLMIESFPSTEIFFWYYFGYTSASFSNQQLKGLLRKKIGYLTEEKYLIKHSLHDILVEAGGSLQVAIASSEQSTARNHFGHAYTEVGTMIRDLHPIDLDI